MAQYVFNATNEKQSVRALGNWFDFKPKQVRRFKEDIAEFMSRARGEQGLVGLSDKFEEHGYDQTDEGKAELAAAELKGLETYLAHLRSIIYNETQALKMDLDVSNMKADPLTFLHPQTLEIFRIVEKYQAKEQDEAQTRADEARKLVKKIGNVRKD